jgi:hypothetical protein
MPHTEGLSFRVGQIDQRVTALELTVSKVKHWSVRLAVMLALWMSALLGHLKAETVAKLIAVVLKGS